LDLSEEEATEFDQLEDIDDVNTTIGGKVQIDIADVDYLELKQDLEEDWLKASQLLETVYKVDINTDAKLKDLKDFIEEKVNNPINGTNKKILIFSVFADTTNYLYRNISSWAKDHLGLESALITGSNVNACTLDVSKQFNNLLTHFSPESKGMFNKDDSKHKEDFEENRFIVCYGLHI
jgi:ERCC4-related helicase